MRRVSLAGGVILVLLLTSCNDDTTMTPGDPADPAFQSFQQEFGNIEETTNSMIQTSFGVIGDILDGPTATQNPSFQGITYTLDYNETAQFWVARLILDDEAGTVATFAESIQFVAGGQPVQYPELGTLDLVRSFLTIDVDGPAGSLSGFQNLSAVPEVDESESTIVVTLNGTGGLEGTFTHSETDSSGTTDCSADASFATTVSQLVLNVLEEAPPCPVSGSIRHNGDLHVVCTGAHAGEFDGHWTVTATFEDGTATVSCSSGGNVWTYSAPCEEAE